MKAKWKKAWIKALRSGEYEQCQGGLHNGNGFCCFGVLTDISTEFDWEEQESGDWTALGMFTVPPEKTLWIV